MDLRDKLNSVNSREELAEFILDLRQDLKSNEADWENPILDRFLEALAAWCVDMPGFFHNHGQSQPDQPDWRLVGRMLMAASTYE